jgi:hypothetical protein
LPSPRRFLPFCGIIRRVRVILIEKGEGAACRVFPKYHGSIKDLSFDPGQWRWRNAGVLHNYTAKKGQLMRNPGSPYRGQCISSGMGLYKTASTHKGSTFGLVNGHKRKLPSYGSFTTTLWRSVRGKTVSTLGPRTLAHAAIWGLQRRGFTGSLTASQLNSLGILHFLSSTGRVLSLPRWSLAVTLLESMPFIRGAHQDLQPPPATSSQEKHTPKKLGVGWSGWSG